MWMKTQEYICTVKLNSELTQGPWKSNFPLAVFSLCEYPAGHSSFCSWDEQDIRDFWA